MPKPEERKKTGLRRVASQNQICPDRITPDHVKKVAETISGLPKDSYLRLALEMELFPQHEIVAAISESLESRQAISKGTEQEEKDEGFCITS